MSFAAHHHARLAATEKPVQLVPYSSKIYDDRDASGYIRTPRGAPHLFDHGAFYGGTLSFYNALPSDFYSVAYWEFDVAFSGAPDEGLDIYGAVELFDAELYLNGRLATTVVGPAGGAPPAAPFFSLRCGDGQGLLSRPKRYTVRFNYAPAGGHDRLYFDFIQTFSRAKY